MNWLLGLTAALIFWRLYKAEQAIARQSGAGSSSGPGSSAGFGNLNAGKGGTISIGQIGNSVVIEDYEDVQVWIYTGNFGQWHWPTPFTTQGLSENQAIERAGEFADGPPAKVMDALQWFQTDPFTGAGDWVTQERSIQIERELWKSGTLARGDSYASAGEAIAAGLRPA